MRVKTQGDGSLVSPLAEECERGLALNENFY